MKNIILSAFENSKIIPVYTNENYEEAKKIVEVCYNAGLRVFEFTNRNEKALEVFAKLTVEFKNHKDLYIGIGTIFTKAEAQKFVKLGAHFIVSPIVSMEVLDYCKTNTILYIPGCGSVTEVYNSYIKGCELVKVFPANVLGMEFVKAVKSVLPNVQIMPTGGVNPSENEIKKWQETGVTCVGIGGKLFDSKLLENKNYEQLTENLRILLSKI